MAKPVEEQRKEQKKRREFEEVQRTLMRADQRLNEQDYFEAMHQRPDPRQGIVTGNNMPIRMNQGGQYNLNFIDWDNEWEAIMD